MSLPEYSLIQFCLFLSSPLCSFTTRPFERVRGGRAVAVAVVVFAQMREQGQHGGLT